MVRHVCEITEALDFIFRSVFRSCEDVSFNIICLAVLVDIKQSHSLMWFENCQLKTPFKCDIVHALIKASIAKTLIIISRGKFSKKQYYSNICCAFLVLGVKTID